MDFLPSWANPLDFLIGFAMLGGAAWGFVRGLIRMVLSLVVLYVAAILAMTFYTRLARWLSFIGGRQPDESVEAIAFVLILVLTAVLINFVLSRTYRDTELPGVRQIDQLGGLVIGFLLTAVWVGLSLVALAYLLYAPIEAGGSVRQSMTLYFRNSKLIPLFYQFLTVVLTTLKPWMPKGQIPAIFAFRLF